MAWFAKSGENATPLAVRKYSRKKKEFNEAAKSRGIGVDPRGRMNVPASPAPPTKRYSRKPRGGKS